VGRLDAYAECAIYGVGVEIAPDILTYAMLYNAMCKVFIHPVLLRSIVRVHFNFPIKDNPKNIIGSSL
jgi:hypothetical protein